MGLLKENRTRIDKDLLQKGTFYLLSANTYASYLRTKFFIEKYVRGKLLDVGCGKMPYRSKLAGRIEVYDTVDIEARTDGVTYVCDAHDLAPIAAESYDSVLCLEVLEHLAHPFRAVKEMERVMRTGGTLVVSAPHLSRIHEAPHDYFRYTSYGLATVLEAAGLKVIEIKKQGGLFCFLGHQLSSGILCATWHVPVLKDVIFFLNQWLLVRFLVFFDRLVFRSDLFASGFVAVARKEPRDHVSSAS